jgi:FAD/FMN-containing dehydrogenase
MQNFGGNVVFSPRDIVQPRDEAELLDALRQFHGRKIRVIGRMHSWSEAVRADDVLLDLRHLNAVEVTHDAQGPLAKIGGGCQIKRVLSELARHGLTLPSLGLITEQTIAGATATGTHGSGRSSLSHYLCAVRIAMYDEQGEPVIRTLDAGDELRAARCSLGGLGVVVSVSLRPRGAYCIEEWFERHDSLEQVLAAETESPLQQFYLVPWSWDFYIQRRRETQHRRSWLAPLYRVYFFTAVDVSLHVVLRLLVQTLRSPRLVRVFYRWILPWTLIRRWHVVDRSQDMLIMEHELFRHIEIEIFVTRSQLPAFLSFVQEILIALGGDASALSESTRAKLEQAGMLAACEAAIGQYVHHYVICVRRVEPDDTLLSMASGGEEDSCAVSLISYAKPEEREGFFQMANLLAHSAAAQFNGRPHWGKVCPLTSEEVARLYPKLEQFRAIATRCDPQGVFRNAWLKQMLGDGQTPAPTEPTTVP